MKIDVLVSTMNQSSKKKLLKEMNLNNGVVIINQVTKKISLDKDCINKKIYFSNVNDKGLSKSRNMAIQKSQADICVIADDDMWYENRYEKTILNAYNKYPDADIIAFKVERENKKFRAKIKKEKRVKWLGSMKLSSVQITFKRKSILNKKIIFDERFGAGSIYFFGEENIFLFDCLKQKLIIYYVPIKIATLRDTDFSTWDKSNSPERYKIQGKIFYRMSTLFFWLFIIQFAIRKRKRYEKDMTTKEVLKAMFQGAKELKNGN